MAQRLRRRLLINQFSIDKTPDLDLTNQGKASNNEKNVDYTNYEEDVYVGYRYFDSFDKQCLTPLVMD
jgi:beta-glucosidase